jgi:hypothetical protein
MIPEKDAEERGEWESEREQKKRRSVSGLEKQM